jgi:hypothetical protein
MLLYTDLDQAIDRAKERAAARATDKPYLSELLQLTYGTHKKTGEIVYRPFYVAARFIQQSRRDQSLKKGDDAEFTGQARPIASLLDQQWELDHDLDIRPQFRIARGGGDGDSKVAESEYKSALVFLSRYQPRGMA